MIQRDKTQSNWRSRDKINTVKIRFRRINLIGLKNQGYRGKLEVQMQPYQYTKGYLKNWDVYSKDSERQDTI